jgi:Clp amino terminal domain, pathogenicity island component
MAQVPEEERPPAPHALSPTPHYFQVKGRAAEIARGLGTPVGPEHLFLGMLHDGGWPAAVISPLVDPGRAEALVLELIGRPDYAPPPAPRFPVNADYGPTWGADIAFKMLDSHIGLEHALLAMIRQRQSVPARALASLADLDALEAAVLEAKNAPPRLPEAAVFLPEGQRMDGPLRKAVIRALPADTTFGFNTDASGRTWMHVFGPGDSQDPAVTRTVLNAALASLDRPALDS